jgi:hypothetical protein
LSLPSIDAEALQDSGDRQNVKDRDDLAKPEGMKRAGFGSARNGLGTPDGEDTDFDWDETDSSDEEEVEAVKRAREEVEADRHRHNVKRAKRLRKVYIACMRLSRPVRTALIALIGGSILIVPAIVVWTAYSNDRSSPVVRDNVKVWSLWLMILWTCKHTCTLAFASSANNVIAAACGTVGDRMGRSYSI